MRVREGGPAGPVGQNVLLLLKAWCLSAPGFNDKQSHQNHHVVTAMAEEDMDLALAALAPPPEKPSGASQDQARKLKRKRSDGDNKCIVVYHPLAQQVID